jgi:CheY-like chemotaxis protein
MQLSKWGRRVKHRIIVIDDQELDLEVIQDLLEENGFQVKTITDVEEVTCPDKTGPG